MKIINKTLMVLVVLTASSFAASTAFAAQDCPGTLKYVQIQNGKALLYFNNSWHKLEDNDHPSYASKVSVAMAAFLSGKSIKVKYGDGYDCNATDYSESATMIRIYQ